MSRKPAATADAMLAEAATANKPLKTPRGSIIRMDLYGKSLEGHPDEGASNDPCRACGSLRQIRLEPLNEFLPCTTIQESRLVREGEWTVSPSGLTRTPLVEKKISVRLTGFSQKYKQVCGCPGGADMNLGHTWMYCQEHHGKSLVDMYHAV